MVLVALLGGLLALGCAPERPPRLPSGEVIVAAGDIADCSSEGDEATAKLVEGIDGAAVLTLGDNAYPEGGGPGLRAMLRADLGTVQGAHQTHPRKPRVRNRRGLSLLRLLR